MNRGMWLALLLALAGCTAGLWFSGFIGGANNDTLPPPLAALQQHFATVGIDTQAGLARAAGRAQLRHNVHFAQRGSKLVFSVQWFENTAAANEQLRILQQYPASAASLANGEFVLTLVDWPVGDPMTQRVRVAFGAFAAPGSAR